MTTTQRLLALRPFPLLTPREQRETRLTLGQEETLSRIAGVLGCSGDAALALVQSTPWTLDEVLHKAFLGEIRPKYDGTVVLGPAYRHLLKKGQPVP